MGYWEKGGRFTHFLTEEKPKRCINRGCFLHLKISKTFFFANDFLLSLMTTWLKTLQKDFFFLFSCCKLWVIWLNKSKNSKQSIAVAPSHADIIQGSLRFFYCSKQIWSTIFLASALVFFSNWFFFLWKMFHWNCKKI